MEGAEPSKRGVMNSRRSRSFSFLLGSYPGISGGPRSRLGEDEDEEGVESLETEVAGFYKAPEAQKRALSDQPLVSQAEPNILNMMEKITQCKVKLTQDVSQGTIAESQHSRLHPGRDLILLMVLKPIN
ncbi:hypothetical protein O181_133446 [Austropuccinia psidii MF-1]|uniref:Uncharacterized protein n=1 Tax=Austropuccinia psidii MF-1 TaxID=1389203 RepID=A0A9Q3L7L5_9BASI|nr:hypothetical protein [Austropuccinia psidii MF-1]